MIQIKLSFRDTQIQECHFIIKTENTESNCHFITDLYFTLENTHRIDWYYLYYNIHLVSTGTGRISRDWGWLSCYTITARADEKKKINKQTFALGHAIRNVFYWLPASNTIWIYVISYAWRIDIYICILSTNYYWFIIRIEYFIGSIYSVTISFEIFTHD